MWLAEKLDWKGLNIHIDSAFRYTVLSEKSVTESLERGRL
jgi:hypothetical protein